MLIQNAVFNHTSLPVLGKSLDAAALRGRAIAANLAHVATPGYQRIEVAFEDALRKALKDGEAAKAGGGAVGLSGGGATDLAQVEPVAYRPVDLSRPSELNNVDIDTEMTKLAENQIAFNFGVRFVQERRGAIESAIRGQAS